MAGKAHKDGEVRPGTAVLSALSRWAELRGLSKTDLANACAIEPGHWYRVLGGVGFLSRAQRRTIESFTEGVITEAMLAGKAKPPAPQTIKGPETQEQKRHFQPQTDGEDVDVEALAKGQTVENVELLVSLRDDPRSSPSLRVRCARTLLEMGEGKPRQRQVQEKYEPPVRDDDLIRKLEKLVKDAEDTLAKEKEEKDAPEQG